MEKTILGNLLHNVEYLRKSLPHLKPEYFEDEARIIFKLLKQYVIKYKKIPTKNALIISLGNYDHSDAYYDELVEDINSFDSTPDDFDWLIDETESFCQKQALYIAINKVIKKNDNAALVEDRRDPKINDTGAIPEILKKALSICFDNSVGHDYFNDADERFDSYHTKTDKIPFRLNILNVITRGGVQRKTLNVLLMGVNVGKTLGLCHLASDYIRSGYNVLYITMEMAEDDLNTLDRDTFNGKVNSIKGKTDGHLIIKQFPTAAASVNHFTSLLDELSTKKSIYPDVVIVDYLGICASSRINGSVENTYLLVKSIAEELRGFAVENNIAIWSAAQTTRGAWGSSDIEMGDTAESAGLPATCDFLLGGIETDETMENGQQMFKQLKSRYGDKSYYNKFMINVHKAQMKWSDVDEDGFTPTQNKMDQEKNEDKKNRMSSILF
jgi:hypothetical protein